MQLVLRVVGGDANGKRLLLRHGQVAKIGRTDWADFSVPSDTSMAEIHFEVGCDVGGCSIADPDGNGTKLDGTAIDHAALSHGQQIKAGNTSFQVEIVGAECEMDPVVDCEGQAVPASDSSESQHEETVSPDQTVASPAPEAAVEYCELLELSDDAKSLLPCIASNSPFELLDALITNGRYADALCLSAGLLSNRDAVSWGAECLRSTGRELSESEQSAAQAVDDWLADPSEENRRAAEAVAKANEFEKPFSWLAMAAFWSNGSMSPVGQPEVPTLWQLAAKGVSAALTLEATGDPTSAESQYATFLELAQAHLKASAN